MKLILTTQTFFIKMAAPDNCLQWFMSSVGTFSSFNYQFAATPVVQQLANQDYTICIRMNQVSCYNVMPLFKNLLTLCWTGLLWHMLSSVRRPINSYSSEEISDLSWSYDNYYWQCLSHWLYWNSMRYRSTEFESIVVRWYYWLYKQNLRCCLQRRYWSHYSCSRLQYVHHALFYNLTSMSAYITPSSVKLDLTGWVSFDQDVNLPGHLTTFSRSIIMS